jgi:co-chaperonin GroES (HSP10)
MPAVLKSKFALTDPAKDEILSKLGDLSGVEIAQNEVMIATYMRPQMTKGGIYLPDQNLREDQYQGKVGLVVKIGPACRFVRTDTARNITYGVPINLHDWVVVRTSDTWPFEFNGDPNVSDPRAFVKCRLVFDDQIRMKVPNPGMIW